MQSGRGGSTFANRYGEQDSQSEDGPGQCFLGIRARYGDHFSPEYQDHRCTCSNLMAHTRAFKFVNNCFKTAEAANPEGLAASAFRTLCTLLAASVSQ